VRKEANDRRGRGGGAGGGGMLGSERLSDALSSTSPERLP
jgi:hypothetical protein